MGIELNDAIWAHPGIWAMQNILEPYDMTVTQCAEQLRMDDVDLRTVLRGESGMSPDIALRFQNLFGVRAATLLAMQSDYDLAKVGLGRSWRQIDGLSPA